MPNLGKVFSQRKCMLPHWRTVSLKPKLPFSHFNLWEMQVKDGADDIGGITDMKRRFPQARVRMFEGSSHSVHNTKSADFVEALKALVDEVS